MMPIQRQSDSFGAFNEGTRWARDRAQTELPKGLAALINTSGPRVTGGMLNTREAGMHYPDEYDPRVDGWPEEDYRRIVPTRAEAEADEHDPDGFFDDYDYTLENHDPERFIPGDRVDPREARRRAPKRPFDREASWDDAATTGTCRWCGDDVRYMPVKPGDPTQGYDYQHEDHPYLDYGHPAEPEGEHYEDGPSWYDEDDPQEWRQASLEDWAGGNENPDRHRIPKRPKDEPGFDPRRDSDFDDDPDPLMGWESLGVDGPRPRGWSQHYYADKKCECWDGYERVPGTKPCAPGSCRKCDSHRKSSRLASGDRLDDLTQRKALNLVKGWMSRYLGHDEDDVPSGDRAYQSGAGLKLHPAYEPTWQDPITGQLNTNEPVPAILHEGYSGWADDASFDDDLRERLNGIGVEPGNWNGSVLTLHPYEEWEIPEHIRRQSRLAADGMSYDDTMRHIDEVLAEGEGHKMHHVPGVDRSPARDHISEGFDADGWCPDCERTFVEGHEPGFLCNEHNEHNEDTPREWNASRQAALPVQPPVVGAHGFQPAHRVGLPWRDSVIPGTVIGLDGPNVAVRWDDGQYSTEEPHNINLL